MKVTICYSKNKSILKTFLGAGESILLDDCELLGCEHTAQSGYEHSTTFGNGRVIQGTEKVTVVSLVPSKVEFAKVSKADKFAELLFNYLEENLGAASALYHMPPIGKLEKMLAEAKFS